MTIKAESALDGIAGSISAWRAGHQDSLDAILAIEAIVIDAGWKVL